MNGENTDLYFMIGGGILAMGGMAGVIYFIIKQLQDPAVVGGSCTTRSDCPENQRCRIVDGPPGECVDENILCQEGNCLTDSNGDPIQCLFDHNCSTSPSPPPYCNGANPGASPKIFGVCSNTQSSDGPPPPPGCLNADCTLGANSLGWERAAQEAHEQMGFDIAANGRLSSGGISSNQVNFIYPRECCPNDAAHQNITTRPSHGRNARRFATAPCSGSQNCANTYKQNPPQWWINDTRLGYSRLQIEGESDASL